MDENHQDTTGSKLIATEDVGWVFNKKSKLGVSRRKRKTSTGFEDKTLWDKLQLFGTLAMPLIIALATVGLGLLQLHLAEVQHQQDQQLALDQQRETTLKTCLDEIKDLLLNKSLRASKPQDEVRIVARGEVLAALRQLNGVRKGLLMQFLSEAGLITSGRNDVIIDLSGADLSGADLSNADLSGAHLSNADLSSADLSTALLSGAIMSNDDLSGADLSDADLNGAHLKDATGITIEELEEEATTLKGATMPDGTTHP